MNGKESEKRKRSGQNEEMPGSYRAQQWSKQSSLQGRALQKLKMTRR